LSGDTSVLERRSNRSGRDGANFTTISKGNGGLTSSILMKRDRQKRPVTNVEKAPEQAP
jgi:hypothetical protein